MTTSMNMAIYYKDGGAFGKFFCAARHPGRDDVWCRRLKGHDGGHGAFVFKISEPEYWEDL